MERIAAKLLHNPVKLNVGKSGVLVANEKIAQEVIVLAEHDKQSRLMEILVSPSNECALLLPFLHEATLFLFFCFFLRRDYLV